MERNEVLHMQVRLFRMACKKWNIGRMKCAELFGEFGINHYIREAYESFHVQGDDANLEDIEEYLKRKGVEI